MFRFVLSNDAGDDPLTLMERHGHVPLPQGEVMAIVEQKDATEAQRQITEIYSGIMAVPAAHLKKMAGPAGQ